MLFIDNEDSVLFILHNHTWVVRACLDLTDVAQPHLKAQTLVRLERSQTRKFSLE